MLLSKFSTRKSRFRWLPVVCFGLFGFQNLTFFYFLFAMFCWMTVVLERKRTFQNSELFASSVDVHRNDCSVHFNDILPLLALLIIIRITIVLGAYSTKLFEQLLLFVTILLVWSFNLWILSTCIYLKIFWNNTRFIIPLKGVCLQASASLDWGNKSRSWA